jgi:DNA polymerase-3 subunit delta
MIIFLYGQDTYRSRQKLNEIIERYKKIQQTSMFAEKKMIVLKSIFPDREFKESFLKNSKKFINSEDIILFFESGEVPRNDSLFKLLKKYGKSQGFEHLEGEQLRRWVKKEFANLKTKIDENALAKLIEFVGSNLWQMENEIRKLVSYKKNKKVEVKDIELLVKPKIETDIFKTIDAIASKNKKQAIELIHKHLEKGDAPLYLLSMINFQFRNLLIVKSQELRRKFYAGDMRMLTEKLKMHPYVIQKSTQQARKFDFEELKKIYQKIFQVDLSIKTGKVEPETALDLFIAEI